MVAIAPISAADMATITLGEPMSKLAVAGKAKVFVNEASLSA